VSCRAIRSRDAHAIIDPVPRGVRWVKVLLGAFAAALVVASCGSSAPSGRSSTTTAAAGSSSDSADYCAGTTPGTQVVVYSTPDLVYWYGDVLTVFEQNCGVSVAFQSDTSMNIAQELEYDKARPIADIVVADAPDLTKVDGEGLLEPGGTPGSSGVPDDRCGPRRDWCDVIENFVSFVYNPTTVKDPPATLDDLLSPRFAGRLLLSDLSMADDGRSLVELLDVTLGPAATTRYLSRLEASVKSHWVTTDTMSRLVSGGQALVANGDLRENSNDLPQYSHLAIWFPVIGGQRTTIATPYGAALVRGGRHRANAIALLKLLWSKLGQSAASDAPGLPARPDVVATDCRATELRQRLDGVRIVRPDWARLGRAVPLLVAAWQRLHLAPPGTPPPAIPIPPLQSCAPKGA
jgi:ABC-type Fe3+ transport system substrate-binding protein